MFKINLKKNLFLILIIFIVSIGAVSASDNSSIDEVSDINTQAPYDNIEISNQISDADNAIQDNPADVKDLSTQDNAVADGLSDQVTNNTFFNYFTDKGIIKEEYNGSDLTFNGAFGNLGVDVITINRPISLLSNGAILNNITFKIDSSNVTIDGFTMNVNSTKNVDIVGIEANNVDNLTIKNSNINFNANSNGTNAIAAVSIDNSKNVKFINNTMDAILSSVPVGYGPAPDYTATILSQAIVISGSNITIDNNKLNVDYNSFLGYYDSIYAYNIAGNNVTFNNNKVYVKGHNYAYGVNIAGLNNTVKNNNLTVVSDTYYSNSLNINGDFSGIVENNIIDAKACNVSYGIYSSNFNGNVKANYTGNTVIVSANTVYGMELMGNKEIVKNNNISSQGNWTVGIVSNTPDLLIANNTISADGKAQGNMTTGDMFKANNTGVLIKSNGNVVIENNNITSTGVSTVEVTAKDSSIKNNYLNANYLTGDASVFSAGVIANNTPIMIRSVIQSEGLIKYYRNGSSLEFKLVDQFGNPLANQTVCVSINGLNYNKTTDVNGTSSISINLNPGNYTTVLTYAGNNSYSKAETTVDVVVLSIISDGKDITLYYRNGTSYSVKVLDEQGNPAVNQKITFNINGMFYNKTTNENGTASLTINLIPGTYIITATTPNGDKMSNNITVLPTISGSNIVKYFRNGTQYSVKVLDGQGNIAVGQNVTFNINGVFYHKVTDDKGIAKLNINLNPGNYSITATTINGLNVNNNVEVLPILLANNLVKNYGEKDSFNITALDAQGKPAANQNITFNINGVFYHKVTDANGIARLNINLKPGQYIITSEYNNYKLSNTVSVIK